MVDINSEQANIGGDVVGRDKITSNTYSISVVLNMTAFTPPPDLAQLRHDYLAHLQRAYHALDFKGIPQLDTFSKELALEDVYVPLVARPDLPSGETWERRTAAERRLAGRAFDPDDLPDDVGATLAVAPFAVAPFAVAPFAVAPFAVAPFAVAPFAVAPVPVRVEEAMRDKSRVVVIGDPGSGKSTLLKHLALRLASEENAPLPILVPLNAFADALSKSDQHLQQYLPEYFAGFAKGIAGLGPLFDHAIATGTAVILLDGLDEVQRDRPNLVARVEAFAQEAVQRGNKLVVTSRIVGYKDAPLTPQEWALYTLLDFDRAAIEQFAAKWCAAFEKSTKGDTPEATAEAETERKSLLAALDANPGVEKLASNPLLLTILALIKRQGVDLPNRRIKLYQLYLETLISAWSKARALNKKAIGEGLPYEPTLAVLAPLALRLREENPTAGLVSEQQLRQWLTEHYMSDVWGLKRGPALQEASRFLKSVRDHSNLLLERGAGQFGFIHLTLEEVLAAYGLVEAGQLDLRLSLAYIERHLIDPGWRETILLAVGVWGIIHGHARVAGEVVRAILNMDCEGNANILLAGACLEDVGELGLGRAAANDVIDALLAASRNRALPPAVQRDAGFSLGRAGWKPDDLDAFITIPAGPFVYQNNRTVVIECPYQIAKYPVTNLQYRRFMDAHGYDRQEFWSDDGWRWRTGTYDTKATEGYEKNVLDQRPQEKRDEPYFWNDLKWNNPLAPVVGVCWFEAEAYCQWLSKELGKPIRLPTEEEWERAARHTDGRKYPWGNEFDRRRLNCGAWWSNDDDGWGSSDAASTTIVGQFSEGNSMASVSDLSGNVWEWQRTQYDERPIHYAIRGGAWFFLRDDVRSANREGVFPVNYNDFIGFRVVSPGA